MHSLFHFCYKLPYSSLEWLYHFIFLQQHVNGPVSLHPCPLVTLSLFILVTLRSVTEISWWLSYVPLVANAIKYHLLCFFANCIFFCCKMSLYVFCLFSNLIFSKFFTGEFLSSLYTLVINLCWICGLQIFSSGLQFIF